MTTPTSSSTKSRTFFLNEKQELASLDKEGGGGQANYVAINWQLRSGNLERSFRQAISAPTKSRDPAVGKHHFIVAVPVAELAKYSTSQKAQAQGGIIKESPDFGAEQSKLFRKLGMDLVETLPDGKAAVHLPVARASQILTTINTLPNASSREQGRWINIDQFEPLDWKTRVSYSWLAGLPEKTPVPTMIRFQPVLTRVEAQDILQVLVRLLTPPSERLIKADRDFSGRYWCMGELHRETIFAIAQEFSSIQSLHPPLTTPVALASPKKKQKPSPTASSSKQPFTSTTPEPVSSISELPIVAVVDTGIPEQHGTLAPYRRAGYRDPDIDPSTRYMGNHGSLVASCVVFGRMAPNQAQPTPGICRVHDVMVSRDVNYINDEIVETAIETVVATAPDVRVFNLSFGNVSLDNCDEIVRRERLIDLQNLDNIAFARDILLVIAAGNSINGVTPEKEYPNHIDDPRWQLGSIARSFNGVVCGAFVDTLHPDAIAREIGAPSPFTLIGPGLCDSPVPGFSAPGGNALPNYTPALGSGIWAWTADSLWEDHVGTSYAAPLLSQQAAWVLKGLARYCPPGVRPFTATAKAWLNLVANRLPLRGALERLAQRTLGKGFATAERLWAPRPESAVFLWQTVLQMPGSISRVHLPIPLDWLNHAKAPSLRIVAAWETPVNSALTGSWGCRKVNLRLRPFGDIQALRGSGNAVGTYPLIDRTFNLHPDHLKEKLFSLSENNWIVEVDYEEVGEYPPAMTFSPQQRVGVAIELLDADEDPVSPQVVLQALPIAQEMTRLSVLQQPIQTPIIIRQP